MWYVWFRKCICGYIEAADTVEQLKNPAETVLCGSEVSVLGVRDSSQEVNGHQRKVNITPPLHMRVSPHTRQPRTMG